MPKFHQLEKVFTWGCLGIVFLLVIANTFFFIVWLCPVESDLFYRTFLFTPRSQLGKGRKHLEHFNGILNLDGAVHNARKSIGTSLILLRIPNLKG